MEKRVLIDRSTLTRQLKSAAAAHHELELKQGKPDADWPEFYAKFIVDSLPYLSYVQPVAMGTSDESHN